MAGDAENTSLWANADVYIAEVGTVGPANTYAAWPSGWTAAGLLNGAEGFTEEREEETSEHYAWGNILYKRTRGQHRRTLSFVALEDNAVVFRLINPNSDREEGTAPGEYTATVRVPQGSDRFAIGFETREGDKVKRRIVAQAEVTEVAEIVDSEENPTVYEITVLVFPSASGDLWVDMKGSATPPETP